ncbi:MAG: MBL fold metallo-hydrolase, partial [Bacteroidota bacterium]
YTQTERDALADFIDKEKLTPVRLINTHCHLDHIFGNRFVADRYGLGLEIHQGELDVLRAAGQVALMYGVPMPDESPLPSSFLQEGQSVEFGNTRLQMLLAPGHSPASLCFYSEEDGFVIGGDVLFKGSIGRADLPGGDYDTLIRSVREQLFPLPEATIVYPGHGPRTTIGAEKTSNPFFQ